MKRIFEILEKDKEFNKYIAHRGSSKKIAKSDDFDEKAWKILKNKGLSLEKMPNGIESMMKHLNVPQELLQMDQKLFADYGLKQLNINSFGRTAILDDYDGQNQTLSSESSITAQNSINYFTNRQFPGFSFMAVAAQDWIINTSLILPINEILERGWEMRFSEGRNGNQVELNNIYNKGNRLFNLNDKLKEATYFNRVFGIRVCMFHTCPDGVDPVEYYKMPFSFDNLEEGSYKGIAQIDPFWAYPWIQDLDNWTPGSIRFYEPNYWFINGQIVHYTHLIILKGDPVAQPLRMQRFFSGVGMAEKMFWPAYIMHQFQNEAMMLMFSKRTVILKTNVEAFMSDIAKHTNFATVSSQFMNNWKWQLIDSSSDIDIRDLNISDIPEMYTRQWQNVTLLGRFPLTKLLGDNVKGFGGAGGYEIETYEQNLAQVEKNEFDPVLSWHNILFYYCYYAPIMGKTKSSSYFDAPIHAWLGSKNLTALQKEQVKALAVTSNAALVAERIQTPYDAQQNLLRNGIYDYHFDKDADKKFAEQNMGGKRGEGFGKEPSYSKPPKNSGNGGGDD